MTEKEKQPNPKLFTAPSDELVRKYGALGAIILHRICLRAQINKEGYSKAGYKDYVVQFKISRNTFYRKIDELQEKGALLTDAELKEKGIPTKYQFPKIKINMNKPEKIEWSPEREYAEKQIEKEYEKNKSYSSYNKSNGLSAFDKVKQSTVDNNQSNIYPINQNNTVDIKENNKPLKKKRIIIQ